MRCTMLIFTLIVLAASAGGCANIQREYNDQAREDCIEHGGASREVCLDRVEENSREHDW